MNRISTLLLILLFKASDVAAQCTSGIFESYVIIDLGAGNVYYDMQASTGNPDFNGAALGTFTCASTLKIQGGQNKTYKCNGADIWKSEIWYRVYPTGSPSGSFIAINEPFSANLPGGCGGDQRWEANGANVNVLSGLTSSGNYTIEVYSTANYQYCGTGTHYSSNFGANYKATFNFTATTWYLDADNDNYYTGTGITQCSSPGAGYKSTGLLGGNDCNDGDATKWQLLSGYVDADGDGYTVGSLLNNICSGATLPSGYSASSLGTDCNDNNASANVLVTPALTISATPLNVCAGANQLFSVATVTNSGASPYYTWYKNGVNQNIHTYNFNYNSSVNGDQWYCVMTSSDVCASPATVTSNTITIGVTANLNWYLDADNDGYYTSGPVTQCTSPGAGYTTSVIAAGDCAPNDNTKWQLLSGYVDADGDGYTVGGLLNNICSGATLPNGYSASSLGSDCNDNNASINPAATEVCGNAIDEDCNGSDLACGATVGVSINVSGTHIICKDEFLTLTATPTFINCPTSGLQWYEDGNPIPGATSTTLTLNRWSTGRFYVAATCGAATVYSDTVKSNIVVITADSNRLCPSTGIELRVEPTPGVTYQWAEGSLTGNIISGANGTSYITSYIGNVWCWMNKPTCQKYGKFRTHLSTFCGTPSAKWDGIEEEIELIEAEEVSELSLSDFGMYPNPATSHVMLETPYLDGNTRLSIYDYNGRIVLQQNDLQGSLHSVDISALSAAVYIVELRTNAETVRKKLVVE